MPCCAYDPKIQHISQTIQTIGLLYSWMQLSQKLQLRRLPVVGRTNRIDFA